MFSPGRVVVVRVSSHGVYGSLRIDFPDLFPFLPVMLIKFWQTETHILYVDAVCELLMLSACLKMHPQPFCHTERKQ